MHWADDGLLDFIDHVADWASGVPILVLATARPELLDRRRAWGGGKLNVATIALTPLSDAEAAEIIHGVLEHAVLPVETQQALLDQAGGNPLYAEQFARLYIERGSADDLPLPETVQGLIAARIDGLALREKQILQDAPICYLVEPGVYFPAQKNIGGINYYTYSALHFNLLTKS